MFTHLTVVSRNAKTGPIPVSTSSSDTCPNACPFNSSNAGGCYANGGPLAIHWRKVTQGLSGKAWDNFLGMIRKLPKGQLWRHNQAGDLAGIGDSLDVDALKELVSANKGKRGFTYTHKPLTAETERQAIREANDNGFTVNLSGNDLSHADTLVDMDIGPVVVVLPASINGPQRITTPKGRAVRVCPATYNDSVTCATCGICQIADRMAIIGFPAHGVSKGKASGVASGVS